ncbi:hypothetical protein [Phenylobacterium sp.]|uniref:hypothetical protein n=1 Tax=Phenylobacterium sp. TaxID=1871053 RepID=UPI00272B0F91|nr:hypothetical protein [Phenylobacterium sp.]
MSPADLKRLNVEHFERVLARTTDLTERAKIARFIVEELAEPDRAYPVPRP